MILDVGLILAAHRLEVAADGPQLHRRVLRPWANVIRLFFFVTDEETKLKRFFLASLSSLSGKARSLPSGATLTSLLMKLQDNFLILSIASLIQACQICVYDNELRFGYWYLLLSTHSLKIKAFNASLFQLGSQFNISKLKCLRFSALDSVYANPSFFIWLYNYFCKYFPI
jgi:hypothetical protein